MFDIAKFNELITQGDLIGLEYLKPFVPSELKERYNNVLTLNYVNDCCKQGKIEGNIFDIYTKNKEDFLRDMGLINIVNGNGGEYMQNKIIKEENNNEEYL